MTSRPWVGGVKNYPRLRATLFTDDSLPEEHWNGESSPKSQPDHVDKGKDETNEM